MKYVALIAIAVVLVSMGCSLGSWQYWVILVLAGAIGAIGDMQRPQR